MNEFFLFEGTPLYFLNPWELVGLATRVTGPNDINTDCISTPLDLLLEGSSMGRSFFPTFFPNLLLLVPTESKLHGWSYEVILHGIH